MKDVERKMLVHYMDFPTVYSPDSLYGGIHGYGPANFAAPQDAPPQTKGSERKRKAELAQ